MPAATNTQPKRKNHPMGPSNERRWLPNGSMYGTTSKMFRSIHPSIASCMDVDIWMWRGLTCSLTSTISRFVPKASPKATSFVSHLSVKRDDKTPRLALYVAHAWRGLMMVWKEPTAFRNFLLDGSWRSNDILLDMNHKNSSYVVVSSLSFLARAIEKHAKI